MSEQFDRGAVNRPCERCGKRPCQWLYNPYSEEIRYYCEDHFGLADVERELRRSRKAILKARRELDNLQTERKALLKRRREILKT